MTEEVDPLVAQCQARVGSMLSGKWRLDALIGVGGMAAVYASTHRNGARAAIKILHAEYAGHAEVRARFLREAYIANKVEHSGTVKVLDDDISENGEPYLVMELLTGASVESRAQRNGGWLKYPEVLSIIEQTLAVLEKAHTAGVVHRDLKPDNLFQSTKGEVKVLDFGIARLHDAASSKRTQTGMMMGTPAYMAPEQALGKWQQVDGRTDLWSVGAIFFTLLSGRNVHEGQTDNEMLIRAATRPAPSLARVVPNAPVEVVRVVDKALQFEQSNRYQDAASMRAAVRQLMAAAGVAPWGTAGAAAAPQAAQQGPASVSRVPAQEVPTLTGGASRGPVPPGSPRSTSVGVAPSVVAQVPAGGTLAGQAPVSGHTATLAAVPAPPVPPLTEGAAALSPEPPEFSGQVGHTTQVRNLQRRSDYETHDAAYASDEDIAAMRELFQEVERSLITKGQYGASHPESRRRADRAFRVCASGLMHTEYGLLWNVTPYAFVAREQILWEPAAPFDRVPYQLFADGVRVLGLLNGLDEREFQTFLGLLTLDRATEVAPEDDFATLLWDAGFEHVVHQVVDTFADGDQQQRVKFEAARDQIVALAHFDSDEQLADAWQERQGTKPPQDMAARQRRLVTRLMAGPADAESAVRAADLKIAARDDTGPVEASALHVDDAIRVMLESKLTMQTGQLSERFTIAVARAYEQEQSRDGGAVVSTPIRFAIDGVAKETPALAIEMVGSMCREVGRFLPSAEGEAIRAKLAGAIVSPRMLESVLAGVQSAGENRDVYSRGLRTILGYCDGTYFSVVLGQVGGMPDMELRDVLVEYLARTGAGHEAEMGEMFRDADLELGLALVRVLAAIKSSAAKEAISHAAHSPHPVVRIEALGHVEGVSSERLRLELRALLEDREPGVRIAALKAMEQYSIRVAGPFLVLRVKSDDFDGLPPEERRQAFQTLSALAPTRTERVALDLVKDRRLVSSESHEVSREIAVEVLSRLGVTQETYEVLADAATARLRNSERVRNAAARALEAFSTRSQQASVGPSSAARPGGASRPPPAPGAARPQGASRPPPAPQKPGQGKGSR